MDTILLYLPPLLILTIEKVDKKTSAKQLMEKLKLMLLGFLPFIVWEIFSIIYYGFPFPNTAYAKLLYLSNITQMDLFEQGYLYFLDSLRLDPITLFAILLGLITAITIGTIKEKSVAIGGGLYLFYVLYIGGDNMSGRFFTSVLIISVILLNRYWSNIRQIEGLTLLMFILFFGFLSPLPTMSIEESPIPIIRMETGATDVKRWLFSTASLVNDKRDTVQPYHEWVFLGKEMNNEAKKGAENVFVLGGTGYAGYFSGPNVIIIDQFGLSDAFLAHLPPVIDKATWRPAHLLRPIPDGYIESVKSGDNKITDPSLSEYYDKLILITRGPIWDWDRFITIYKMNTGQYDYLIRDYVAHSR